MAAADESSDEEPSVAAADEATLEAGEDEGALATIGLEDEEDSEAAPDDSEPEAEASAEAAEQSTEGDESEDESK